MAKQSDPRDAEQGAASQRLRPGDSLASAITRLHVGLVARARAVRPAAMRLSGLLVRERLLPLPGVHQRAYYDTLTLAHPLHRSALRARMPAASPAPMLVTGASASPLARLDRIPAARQSPAEETGPAEDRASPLVVSAAAVTGTTARPLLRRVAAEASIVDVARPAAHIGDVLVSTDAVQRSGAAAIDPTGTAAHLEGGESGLEAHALAGAEEDVVSPGIADSQYSAAAFPAGNAEAESIVVRRTAGPFASAAAQLHLRRAREPLSLLGRTDAGGLTGRLGGGTTFWRAFKAPVSAAWGSPVLQRQAVVATAVSAGHTLAPRSDSSPSAPAVASSAMDNALQRGQAERAVGPDVSPRPDQPELQHRRVVATAPAKVAVQTASTGEAAGARERLAAIGGGESVHGETDPTPGAWIEPPAPPGAVTRASDHAGLRIAASEHSSQLPATASRSNVAQAERTILRSQGLALSWNALGIATGVTPSARLLSLSIHPIGRLTPKHLSHDVLRDPLPLASGALSRSPLAAHDAAPRLVAATILPVGGDSGLPAHTDATTLSTLPYGDGARIAVLRDALGPRVEVVHYSAPLSTTRYNADSVPDALTLERRLARQEAQPSGAGASERGPWPDPPALQRSTGSAPEGPVQQSTEEPSANGPVLHPAAGEIRVNRDADVDAQAEPDPAKTTVTKVLATGASSDLQLLMHTPRDSHYPAPLTHSATPLPDAPPPMPATGALWRRADTETPFLRRAGESAIVLPASANPALLQLRASATPGLLRPRGSAGLGFLPSRAAASPGLFQSRSADTPGLLQSRAAAPSGLLQSRGGTLLGLFQTRAGATRGLLPNPTIAGAMVWRHVVATDQPIVVGASPLTNGAATPRGLPGLASAGFDRADNSDQIALVPEEPGHSIDRVAAPLVSAAEPFIRRTAAGDFSFSGVLRSPGAAAELTGRRSHTGTAALALALPPVYRAETSQDVTAAEAPAGLSATGAPAASAATAAPAATSGSIDLDDLAERTLRKLVRMLAIEKERRGAGL